jgi:hypothetical protein
MESFNKEGQIKVWGSFSKRWPRKFCSEMCLQPLQNLIPMPKYYFHHKMIAMNDSCTINVSQP